jgi:hypothetical protein
MVKVKVVKNKVRSNRLPLLPWDTTGLNTRVVHHVVVGRLLAVACGSQGLLGTNRHYSLLTRVPSHSGGPTFKHLWS